MALRDQPYIPLYVQDFLTDEKLNECSAESAGVYIMLMCVMHKSNVYGTILLRQKDRQSESKVRDFAVKLTKHLPYDVATIERSLTELIDEGVLTVDGDTLYQKRMVKDGKLSEARSAAGKKELTRQTQDFLPRQIRRQNSQQTLKMKLKVKMNLKVKVNLKMNLKRNVSPEEGNRLLFQKLKRLASIGFGLSTRAKSQSATQKRHGQR